MVPIFVVMTILLLVSIDAIVQASRKRREAESPARVPAPGIDQGIGVPAGLFLHPGHTWMELQPVGTVRMGLDAFVAKALGRIDRVRLLVSEAGQRVRQGQPLLAVERDGKSIVLPCPVSGTLRSTNRAAAETSAAVTASPYRTWLCVIEPSRLGQELFGLKVAENAKVWLQQEVGRFSDWITDLGARGVLPALPDGGVPAVGVMGELEEEQWSEFQQEFCKVEPLAAS